MGKIYIVAGHGAGDPGAIGNGYQESDLTRKIANDLYNRLKDKNIVLYPTSRDLYRSKDYGYFTNADYVLEIHFNSAANTSANGTELLIKQGYQPDNRDKAIYNAVAPYFSKRGIKTSNALANMNQFAKRGIGYSLLEVCFICNSNDMATFNQNYNAIIDNLVVALGGSGNTSDVKVSQADEWVNQNGKWWYRHADGSYTKNDWEMINGKWYYFDADGWMVTGWVQVKSKWYWLKENGAMASDEIITINNKDYVFAESGYMRRTADMVDGKLD